MPTAKQNIPFLELDDIDFSIYFQTSKRKHICASNSQSEQNLGCVANVIQSPTYEEKEKFFQEIAEEKNKLPLILSDTIISYHVWFFSLCLILLPSFDCLIS